jgi:protein involved in polysaccharide export with SLBB domain
VTIPEHTDHVTVMEAVVHPGAYPIPEKGKLTLSEAIAMAGGRQPNARDIVLIRPRAGQPENPEITVISPTPTGKNGQNNTQQLQQELKNGDIIYVYPGKVTEPKSRTILSLLTPFSFLLR